MKISEYYLLKNTKICGILLKNNMEGMIQMKKIISLLAAVCLICAICAPVIAFADDPADDPVGYNQTAFILNGNEITIPDGYGLLQHIDGRTMMPVRAFFEALNYGITYDDTNRQVLAMDSGNDMVFFQIGTPTIYFTVNGAPKTATGDVPPQMIDNRSYLPVRVIAEGLGYTVDYQNGEVIMSK